MIKPSVLDIPIRSITLISLDAALGSVSPVVAGRRDARERIGSLVTDVDPPAIKLASTIHQLLPDPRFPENIPKGSSIRAIVTSNPENLPTEKPS